MKWSKPVIDEKIEIEKVKKKAEQQDTSNFNTAKRQKY